MTGGIEAAALAFIGSFIGGLGRHLLSGWIAARTGDRFPWGIMAVNVSGAFLIGVLWVWVSGGKLAIDPGRAHAFFMSGVLGGYTTVSSFALKSLILLREKNWWLGGANIFGTWLACLAAVFFGVVAARVL